MSINRKSQFLACPLRPRLNMACASAGRIAPESRTPTANWFGRSFLDTDDAYFLFTGYYLVNICITISSKIYFYFTAGIVDTMLKKRGEQRFR